MTDMTIALKARALANEPGGGHFATLRQLLPYLWPEGRPDLRWRVVVALIALFASKVVTVWAPFAFKDAVDILGSKGPLATALSVTVALILAYALARIMMVVLAQIRDGLFARVGQNAVRELSVITFRHLHALSLKFHLERRTGGLSRIISRGTQGIDTLLRYSLFNTFPTLIELAFVCGILAWKFGWLYAVVTFVTVIVYIVFTYSATEWRIGIRRTMNDADTDANTKAIDSLLNFETVKYFGNEEHETRRFGVAMDRYEQAAIRTWTSLTVLNSGQAVLFSIGLAIVMAHGGHGCERRAAHGRRLRHGQRPDDPALSAAQLHGVGLSRHQAGADRRRGDVQAARCSRRHHRPAGRRAADRRQGRDRVRRCALPL